MNKTETADPEEVDREPVLAIGDCPNCGPKTLATVKVEDSMYISSCSMCDFKVTAPVVEGDDGEHYVDNDQSERHGVEADNDG